MLLISIIILAMGIYIIVSPDLIIATLGMIIFIFSIMDLIEGITFVINIKRFEKWKYKNKKELYSSKIGYSSFFMI